MKPYRTNLRDVPHVAGLKPKDGWINMQVQFLIDQKTANSDKLVLGWTVLPPGARHDAHRHFHADQRRRISRTGMDQPAEGQPLAHSHGGRDAGIPQNDVAV